MRLTPFVWASISLKGKLLKRYPDDIHPAPKADMVIGDHVEDWSYPNWTHDRHNQIRKGDMLRAEGRYLYELHDVVVAPVGGRIYLVLEPGIVAAEATRDAKVKRPGSAELRLATRDGGKPDLFQMPAYEIIKHETRPSVLYAHDWMGNRFHYLMDTLTRAWAEKEGLVSPDTIPASDLRGAVRYATLYFPSFWPTVGYCPAPVTWLRHSHKGIVPRECSDVLYFTRDDVTTRRLTNEAEVLRVIRELGLSVETVRCAKLSHKEQVAYAKGAKMIIGPDGAALTNAIFATNASVLEFVPQARQACCYQYLTKWSGNSYYRMICQSGEADDMTIDLDGLSAALRTMQDNV